MSDKTKTDEELKKRKKLEDAAREKALAMLMLKDEEKKRADASRRKDKEKSLRLFSTKKCKSNEKDFHIKIKYRCKSICGNKYYIFNNVKDLYPFINTNDIVLYDNPKHSNHNREAVVIHYKMGGFDSKDIDKSKRVPYFLIKFIEPLDKLPYYHLNVNGLKVKTNKKIVVIDGVPYDKLKLVYSTTKSDVICLSEKKIKDNASDFEKILKEKYDMGSLNAPLNFKEFIKNVFNDTNEIIKKVVKDKLLKKDKTVFKLENNFTTKLRLIIKYLKKFNPEEPLGKKKKEFQKLLNYFDTIFEFKYNTTFLEKYNENLKSKSTLIIYIYIYHLLVRKSKKNLKYIKNFKDNIENVNNDNIKKFIEIIKKLQTKLDEVKAFFIEKYKDLFKDSTDNIERKIMKIVLKNLADIKKGIKIKPYTYKHFIMDQLKLKVLKYFKIGEEFKPVKVFFKYANPELVKLDLKEQIKQEKEREEQFIYLNTNNKLVNPTSDKIFILTNINSVFDKNEEKKVNDIDDYFNDNVFINIKNNQIEIKLDIGLTVKDKKSKDILFEDKSKQINFLNSIKNVVNSIQENLECTKSKENINKDIKDIKKKFGIIDDDKNKLDDKIEDTSIE
mgnify:CR=1 FL=1|jgi:hypothetical protein